MTLITSYFHMSIAQSKMSTKSSTRKYLTIEFVNTVKLDFDEWAEFAHTYSNHFTDDLLYKAALKREWERLLDKTGGKVEHEIGWEDEDVEAALEDFEDCAKDEKNFVIQTSTLTLLCPDGSTKKLTETDEEGEFYVEWNDIGIFYYPNGKDGKSTATFWVQGQMPTYPGNPDLDANDNIWVTIE